MATLLDWLFGARSHDEPPPDPLRDLLETGQAAERNAWETVNESRQQRGERPIAPPANPAEALVRARDRLREQP